MFAATTWWNVFAHDHQRPPLAAQGGGDWTTWLLLGGRGAGKTHAGAAWVHGVALGVAPYAAAPVQRIALIGGSEAEVREVMVEGVSGLLANPWPGKRPSWISSRRRVEWPNGAVAQVFSAEDPESLRGPQFGAAWCDEIAKWRYKQACGPARRRNCGRNCDDEVVGDDPDGEASDRPLGRRRADAADNRRGGYAGAIGKHNQ